MAGTNEDDDFDEDEEEEEDERDDDVDNDKDVGSMMSCCVDGLMDDTLYMICIIHSSSSFACMVKYLKHNIYVPLNNNDQDMLRWRFF